MQRTLKKPTGNPIRDFGAVSLLICAPIVLIAAYYLSGALYPNLAPILIALPLMGLFVFGALLLPREGLKNSGIAVWIGLLALLAAALFLRLWMSPFKTDDYHDCIELWIRSAAILKGFSALGETVGNYNAPYFYLLWCIAKITNKLEIGLRLPYVKLLSVAFDLIAARYGMLLTERLTGRKKLSTAVFFLILFLPTVMVNGAMWGQCDSIYLAFCLAGLYYGLEKCSMLCFACFSLAFSFKLQAVFLLPMLLVLLMAKRIRWRDIWAFPTVFMLLLAPALLMGRPLNETLGVYIGQMKEYPFLSMNAPSVFGFIPGCSDLADEVLENLGILAAFGYLAALLFYLYLRRDRLSDDVLILASLAMAIGIPFLLPHMHERYFYAADLLSVIAATKKRSRIPIPVLTVLSSVLAYLPYLYHLDEAPIPIPILSAMMLISLAFTLRELFSTTENQVPEIRH